MTYCVLSEGILKIFSSLKFWPLGKRQDPLKIDALGNDDEINRWTFKKKFPPSGIINDTMVKTSFGIQFIQGTSTRDIISELG